MCQRKVPKRFASTQNHLFNG
ncbi:rCG57105 [Rattus norvegicus]|uniref:RCG57105 n=1 Tax=Rattus norvegicus TaxID=10116 RepID=A6JD35_RAT|nr:rCG57105 [Rattus norvegicus]